MKHINLYFYSKLLLLVLILPSVNTACATTDINKKPIDVKLAIIGNTGPDSPFIGYSEKLPEVFELINNENPLAVIHTGNIIHGGEEWMGISRDDIMRQFDNFLEAKSKLYPIMHTVLGDDDLYNKTADLYIKYMNKELNYSFNYGNIHFIIYNTVNTKFDSIQKQHLKWLKKDLDAHRQYASILVFTYNQIIGVNSNSENNEQGENTHRLLSKYPVKAVFSGNYRGFYTFKKDDIQYFLTGCGGYTKEKNSWQYNQYYILELKDGEIQIKGKKIYQNSDTNNN